MSSQTFPTAQGQHAITREWTLFLPTTFKRRIEDGDLYLWQDGLTLLFAAWSNDLQQTRDQCLATIEEDASSNAYDRRTEDSEGLSLFSYRLSEESGDKRVAALYAYVIADSGYLQVACYFDDEATSDTARGILKSIRLRTVDERRVRS